LGLLQVNYDDGEMQSGLSANDVISKPDYVPLTAESIALQ